MKLDTSAEVSVLPLQVYNELQVKPPLRSTNIRLTAYDGALIITPAGTCKLTCSSPTQNRWDVKFYVASVQAQPILGLHDCIHLGLIKRVCTLEQGMTKSILKEKCPTVFKGLGSLGMYHITLEDKHTPVINPSRRIPHSLKNG